MLPVTRPHCLSSIFAKTHGPPGGKETVDTQGKTQPVRVLRFYSPGTKKKWQFGRNRYKLQGNRFMTVTDSLWIPEMAKILDEEFRPLGYNVPTRVAPNFVLRILGLFSGSVKMILPSLGCEQKFDNSKVKHHLQYKATELRTSIIDMAYSMIDGGFIYKTLQYQEKKAQ
ncbi:hypothetical protein P5673_026751 [Acropora cervicornis]|uniref:Uncharacterized protein n=1 Tax=Acropora cervicornis TaxID=6130 RepID=A0AAD9PZZ8_ACRCE|nr:hypothetical protein P5673_026751 [Acropora cervicornis]